jgi:CheY-like chemotaxis protein
MMSESFPFSDKSILLCEDHPDTQEVMKDMMEILECSLDIANDGLEAIEKWKTKKYDLIIMDIQMPRMDGYQASRKIRELEQSTSNYTPILALTASALAYDRDKCLDAGMDSYLSKPITFDILESKLKELFNSFT